VDQIRLLVDAGLTLWESQYVRQTVVGIVVINRSWSD